MTANEHTTQDRRTLSPERPIKLVVWDLDNTLWNGVLLEGGAPDLRDGVRETIIALDERGVLQSIASRNDFDAAIGHLRQLGLYDYFLFPQINWGVKSQSVKAITEELNIALDAVLFIDDQQFEREEVSSTHDQVRTLPVEQVPGLLANPALAPAGSSTLGPRRRAMYREEQQRKLSEESFSGASDDFVASLDLRLRVDTATPDDLQRAEELIVRTNQLNSTGLLYTRAELLQLLDCPRHTLLVARLSDRFGDYDVIALALIEKAAELWTLKLTLVSCRVLSRGIGSVLLLHLAEGAKNAGSTLRVSFRDTGRNRPMRLALMMAGFVADPRQEGDTSYFRQSEQVTGAPASPVTILANWWCDAGTAATSGLPSPHQVGARSDA